MRFGHFFSLMHLDASWNDQARLWLDSRHDDGTCYARTLGNTQGDCTCQNANA